MTAFVRIATAEGDPSFARVDGDRLHLLRGAPWADPTEAGGLVSFAGARLLSPVSPTKIIGIGSNYPARAAVPGCEVPSGPLLFLKPPSALVGPGAPIVLPPDSTGVEHEAELGVIVGVRCRGVPADRALEFVFGYTCINDVTARDLQREDGQWTRAKSFDSFCPAGPLVVTGLDPRALRVCCRVNDAVRQEGNTRDMLFTVAHLLSFASRVMTLEPGDLITTGTPSGVGPLSPGDVVEVEIEGIGVLRNPVVARMRPPSDGRLAAGDRTPR
jgi:2-keto-4-pentenoate hydratase/2-oxohepta-3-ene-1,7-dioic acid hydratase in catechol pathway